MKRLIIFYYLFLLIFVSSCEKNDKNPKIPTCDIIKPNDGDTFKVGDIIEISVVTDDSDGNLFEARLYIDNNIIDSSKNFPYNYNWNTSGEEIGSHTLKVLVKDNDNGSSSDEIDIFLADKPNADFSADKTSVKANDSIQFTDKSTNTPISWEWDFGDGNTSTEQNPLHSYSTVDTYTVSLIVSNSYGSDTEIKTDYIKVPDGEIGTVTDYNGNSYSTIKIGFQWWMTENLKTTRYSNGDLIPLVESNDYWDSLGYEDKAMCYYNNNENNEADTYGALYTWAAAMNGAASSETNPSNIQGVCPSGWHLPSEAEWDELIDYLGGESVAGDKMKEIGTIYWKSTLTNITNESGFTALSGGYRSNNGSFSKMSITANFWSARAPIFVSPRVDSSRAINFNLEDGYSGVYRNAYEKNLGSSVRCVKD